MSICGTMEIRLDRLQDSVHARSIMNGKCTDTSTREPLGRHSLNLQWEHIITRTDATETTGGIYQAVLKAPSQARLPSGSGITLGGPRPGTSKQNAKEKPSEAS